MAYERRVVQAGYLIKSPPQERLMAQWHKRYFILLSTKVMEYYSSHECKPQDYLKSINLSQCEDMVAPLPIPGRPYVIKLSVKTGPKLRDYFLDCSNEVNMSSWVMSLAQTCGFCPVDAKVAEQDDEFYLSDNFSNQILNRPRLQPPLHSSDLKASFSQVNTMPSRNDKDNKSIASSALEQDWNYYEQFYDDLGINGSTIYAMNKNPPPVWKPNAPFPPNKVERPTEPDNSVMETHLTRSPILPQNKMEKFAEPDNFLMGTHLLTKSPILSRNKMEKSAEPDNFVMGTHPTKSPILPPNKMEKSAEPDSSVMGTHLLTKLPIVPFGSSSQSVAGSGMQMPDILSFKNDPKFMQKLQEKRQELYGEGGTVLRDRSVSMGVVQDMVPQESYKSIDSNVWSGVNLQYNSEDNPMQYLNVKSDMISGSAPQIHPKTLMRNAAIQNCKSHVQQAMPVSQREVSGFSSSPSQCNVAIPLLPSQELMHPPPTVSSSQSLSSSPHEESIMPPIRKTSESLPFLNPLYPLSYEDTPPPIPVRISSNHMQSSSSSTSGSTSSLVPPVEDVSSKQRLVPSARHSSSPTDSRIPKQHPLPPYYHNIHRTESSSFMNTLSHILSSHQSKERSSTSPGLTRREPTPVLQRELSTDDYDDIEFTGSRVESSNMGAYYNYPDPTVNIAYGNYPDPTVSIAYDNYPDPTVSILKSTNTYAPDYDLSFDQEEELYDDVVFNPLQQKTCEQRLLHSPPCEQQFPHSPPCERELSHSPPCERQLPHSPPCEQRLPHSPPCERQLPHSPPCERQLPHSLPCERRLPHSSPCERRLPHSPPRERQLSHSPTPPDRQDIQPNRSEDMSVLLSLESHLQASLRANNYPPVPPVKPKIPSDKKPSSSANHHLHQPPPVRPKSTKLAVTEKPVVEKLTKLAQETSLMGKPPVAKKTIVSEKVSMQVKPVAMPVKKAGTPPRTHPKPSKIASVPPLIGSANSSKHQEQIPTIVKHKPKPPRVPEKPLQVPLCS